MDLKHKSQTKPTNSKPKKPNKTSQNLSLHKLTTLFRCMETFFLLVIISNQLPSLVKRWGYYLTGSSIIIVFSPKLVFMIGNIIILILFLRSRVGEHKDEIVNDDMCYEYVKRCDRSVVNDPVIVGEDKRICRSKSESMMSVKCGEGGKRRELRRSVTEVGRLKRSGDGGKAAVKDELSCEDFRLTVEAFIARQQKILRDEELCPIAYIG